RHVGSNPTLSAILIRSRSFERRLGSSSGHRAAPRRDSARILILRGPLMLRVVLDAIVFVSAYIRPEGPPGLILGWFLRYVTFELVLTEAIVEEVLAALALGSLSSGHHRGVSRAG